MTFVAQVNKLAKTLQPLLPADVPLDMALAQCSDGQLWRLWQTLAGGAPLPPGLPLVVQRLVAAQPDALRHALRPIMLRQQAMLQRLLGDAP